MGIEDISLKQDRDTEPEIIDKKLAAKLQEINDAWPVCPERAIRLVRHYKLHRLAFVECFKSKQFPNVLSAWSATIASLVPAAKTLHTFDDVTIREMPETASIQIRYLTPKNKKVFHITEIIYSGDTVIVNNEYIKGADRFCIAMFEKFGSDAKKEGIKVFEKQKCLWRGILCAQRVERSKLI